MKKIVLTGMMLFSLFAFAQNPGSLDTSFGTGGKVVTSINTGADKAYSTALQSDGKILVAGLTTSGATGKDFAIVRYNADGSLDANFGTNGIVTTDLQGGSDDVAYSMALQADGKIILAGYSDDGSQKKAALVRYTSTGAVDTDFGTNGKVYTSFEGTLASEIKVIKIHTATGNLVVGGNAAVSSTKAKPVVARYTAAGMLDTNFNTTGIKPLWLSTNDQQYLMTIEDIAVQTNGKISAVGWLDFPSLPWDSDYRLYRINSNGSMDTTFSTDGENTLNGTFNGHDRAYGLVLKDDNSMVVAGGGYVTDLNYSMTLFEMTPAGAAAGTSSQENIAYAELNDAIAYDVEFDVNGKFVMAGSNGMATAKTFAISRVNADYTIDNSFDTDGKVTTTFGANTMNEAFDAVIQPDNKIVAVGYTGNDFAVARYLGTAATNSVADFGKNAISLSPNPANNILNISVEELGAYTIYDMNGRPVLKSAAASINIGSLQSGMYILKMDATGASAKFVKM
ncbi:T9SS type A sorting domain-containing protein [Flavobacterium sp. MFBS3-15]|uniref:T9SS type A sorting domain-containing protein n=1 Tax=Flavobacterium sp. MFBS3-15 TaxID=2989816 RepID=UPI002235A513|nr:T9SS type A sorting domain-containing protein [Flavobacterium sp. MFBS3-15]MCW4470706.1 T9SS type A sorting domain-containing protein [Flavobacterium sp. MFBS3-15]